MKKYIYNVQTGEHETIEVSDDTIAYAIKDGINQKVRIKIREKYDVDKEFEMQRKGIIDPDDIEYKEYLSYVNECLEWGKVEKAFYDIKDKITNENKTFVDLINTYDLTATQKRIIRTRLENENLI